ncbi:MAG: hypothetical protein JWO05_3079 [Gemmatimonadetes bacterium]|nr:hypothetical protein [Gemmatimonadota bacterium]
MNQATSEPESSTAAAVGSTAHATKKRVGLSRRGERIFHWCASALVLLLAIGWVVVGVQPHDALGAHGVAGVASSVVSSITAADAPTAAYLTDALLQSVADPLRGTSGKLRVRFSTPDSSAIVDTALAGGAKVAYTQGASVATATPQRPGIWGLALKVGSALKPIADLSVITMHAFSEKRSGRVGMYYLGAWPGEKGRVRSEAYANPSGFIEVTRENEDTPVSAHFKLRDFLPHDQQDVWPKMLVLRIQLLDKLELTLDELERRGISTKGVKVMSGFRSPQYNAGGGNTAGRAELSRHMYGDAADIFIDNDGNGQMDDLNHDGRIDIGDSRVIGAAVDAVERAHPETVGGCGVYVAGPGHGPFTHIDARGYHARWTGTGGG